MGHKILGVSIGGALGSLLGPLGAVAGSRLSHTNPLDDLKAGARNAGPIAAGTSILSHGNGAPGGGGGPTTAPDGTPLPPGAQQLPDGSWVDTLGNFIKNNAGDILKTGATAVAGYMSAEDRAKQLAEQRREYDASLGERQAESAQSGRQFDRTTGDTEAQAAVRAETQLNKAPIADKAQALILARMGVSPGRFQPRDYTQGTDTLTQPHAAPGAPVADAMQHAATSYQPGQGGVDTSAVKALLAKLTGSSGMNVAPPSTPLPPPSNPGTRPYPVTPTPPLAVPKIPAQQTPAPITPPEPTETDPNDPAGQLLRRMQFAT